MPLGNVENIAPSAPARITKSLVKMRISETFVFALMLGSVMAQAAGHPAKSNRRDRDGPVRNDSWHSPVASHRHALATLATRSPDNVRHMPASLAPALPHKRAERSLMLKEVATGQADRPMEQAIKRSFARNGDNLGDRVAERIVTELPGWPADRSLVIVTPDEHGAWKSIRCYPCGRQGPPVRLYLGDDHVYVAIAERGSTFGEGAQITVPRDVDRGNSFYIALQAALSPGQRTDMGIDPWNEMNIAALREKTGSFAVAPENKRYMRTAFRDARTDGAWLAATRQRIRASTTPAPTPAATVRPMITTAACDKPTRVETIGPADAASHIACHIYVHDDVLWSTDAIVQNRLRWWLDAVTPLLPAGTGLKLSIWRGVPGVTNSRYVAPAAERTVKNIELANAIERVPHGDCPRETDGYHLLLTGYKPDPKALGYATPLIRFAMACIQNPRTAGHELGHLFGATHELGKVDFRKGRYCDTTMYVSKAVNLRGARRSDCGGYSAANEAAIRQSLASRHGQRPDSHPR